jgi:FkbM family methyltransferase
LIPDYKLSPTQRFVRDGLSSRIYSSVPRARVSKVLVFGGYKGASVEGWLKKSPLATVQTYEPVPDYADILCDRFRTDRVEVHRFGVGEQGGSRTFFIMGDATSGHPAIFSGASGNTAAVEVIFQNATDASKTWPATVDVAEVNIEGGEYELLSALAEAHLLSRIRDVFVQFHDVGPETPAVVAEARSLLAESHRLVWCYDMVWEYWTRLDSASAEQ